MSTATSATAPRRPRRLLKVLGICAVGLAAVLAAAHLLWKHSGSGEWQLAVEKNGVRIYERKVPGDLIKTYRAQLRIRSTVARAVGAMMDRSVEACAEWNAGCVAEQTVEPWNDRERYYIHFFRMNAPGPMSPREFLLKAQFTPDAQGRSVFIQYTAMPDKLPANDCCYRIRRMNNSWRFTPAPDGELEVEFLQDLDAGIPYFLYNLAAPGFVYDGLALLPKLLNKEKYDQERIPFLAAASVR
jgi:hypothetical protein